MTNYLLFVVPILAVLWGLHHLWRRKVETEIAEGADEEFALYERKHTALMEGVDAPRFRAAYGRTHRPRYPAYVLGALTAFLVGTPIALGLLSGGSYLMARMAGEPDFGRTAANLQLSEGGVARVANRMDLEQLQLVLEAWSGFYYFFGLLAFWVAIVAFAMRRYHARAPGLLDEEVAREKGATALRPEAVSPPA